MIKIKDISIRNFLSIGNTPVVLQLDDKDLTLIRGKNGQGKSIILDALTFAFFGKPFRKIKKGGMVNSINSKQCIIELNFSSGKKQYKIIRGISPNKFEIYENDKLIDQDAKSKDYQKYLEENIIKMNHKSFTQIVILGSASFVPFMKLTAPDRRLVIEDILDIHIFSEMKAIVKEQTAKIKEELKTIESELEIFTEKYTLIESHLEKLTQFNQSYKKEKLDSIEQSKQKVQEILKETEKYKRQIEELKKDIKDDSELKSKLKELEKIESSIDSKIRDLKKTSNFYQSNDSCSVCGQDIDEDFKNKIISDNKEELDKLEAGLKNVAKLITKQESQIEEIEEIHDQVRESTSSYNAEIRDMKTHTDFIKKVERELEEAVKKNENVDDSELKDMEGKIKERKSTKAIVKKKKHYHGILAEMLNDGGIKTQIIKQYIPIINRKMNEYLQEMDFFVNFQLDDEFNETIKSRYRDDFSYESFSEGEKKRIDVALLLTWRYIAGIKKSVDVNLLVLDEVLDSSLDQQGIDDVMKLFRTLKNSNVYIVSHRGDVLDDKFDHKLNVKKVKNFTQIEYED